jgi:crotonobetainyl-CoA:carnitine CoA-transferase CaiB-like acyl-CoA transferase
MAIGSDAQWHRFIAIPMFASLAQERFDHNEGRRKHRKDLNAAIEAITQENTAAAVSEVLIEATIPHSPITPIEEVPDLPFVASTALRTTTPDGRPVRLPPPAVSTEYLEKLGGELPFAPSFGEHTDAVLGEVGLSPSEISALREKGVVA